MSIAADSEDKNFSFLEPLPNRMKKGREPSNLVKPSFRGYMLALEGGGSRSQAVLIDDAGKVLQSVSSSDVNINFTSFEQAQHAVFQIRE